jgi:signal transduction histidine kinase
VTETPGRRPRARCTYRDRMAVADLATSGAPVWSRRAIWGSALGVAVFQVMGTFGAADNQLERRGIDALAIVLLLVGPAALAVRDRWPVLAVVVTIAAADLWVAFGFAFGPIVLSVIVALVSAVLIGQRRATWVAAAAGYVGFLIALAVDPNGHKGIWWPAIVVAGWLLLVLSLAEVVRARRDQVVERRRLTEIDRQRRADEQRLDLAQELHDVLAHTISLINVQASVALHLLDEQPERARPALTEIKQHSSEALGELRVALDVLRRGDAAPRTPAPRLADLPALVDSVRASGLDVRLQQHSEPDHRDHVTSPALPPATELAAYRIVQEALTNVTRHSRARSVVVEVRVASASGADGGDRVHLEVSDDGIGGAPVDGNGITGMRERAASVGGTVSVGPAPGGGFRVVADLPGVRP